MSNKKIYFLGTLLIVRTYSVNMYAVHVDKPSLYDLATVEASGEPPYSFSLR